MHDNEYDDLVSVIMPSYNSAKYIEDSIRSVLKQTYEKWELIIVDDCSIDDTESIVKKFLVDDRIRFFKNESNSGAAVSRNFALKEAKGRWIAFLDSDDLWLPEKLEKQLKYMKENNYSFTYTDYRIQLNNEWLPYIYYGPDIVNKRKMHDYCYFSTITVMYDSKQVGLVQIESIKKNNDYAMWLRIIDKTPCYRFPECLSYYIKHDGSISSGSKLKLIKHHYIMWRVAEHKSSFLSCVFTVRNLFWGVIKKIRYRKYIGKEEKLNVIV